MKRFDDWPERLRAAIQGRRRIPYAWGANDCAIYCAVMIEAQTGENFANPFIGSYCDEEGATELLRAKGWDTLEGMADAHLDRTETPKRGDIVLLPGELGDYLAVCIGKHAVGPTDEGSRTRSLNGMIAAWKVG